MVISLSRLCNTISILQLRSFSPYPEKSRQHGKMRRHKSIEGCMLTNVCMLTSGSVNMTLSDRVIATFCVAKLLSLFAFLSGF
jgi:hypothetical protein